MSDTPFQSFPQAGPFRVGPFSLEDGRIQSVSIYNTDSGIVVWDNGTGKQDRVIGEKKAEPEVWSEVLGRVRSGERA